MTFTRTRTSASVIAATIAATSVFAACTSMSTSSSSGPMPSSNPAIKTVTSATPPSPDPRVGLAAGTTDSVFREGQAHRVIHNKAAEAQWNIRLISNTPASDRFLGVTNSDLAFSGNYAFQGNYNGYQVWDISNPAKPTLRTAFYCPASQSDVSVYKNLLFVSSEGQTGRHDCRGGGFPDSVRVSPLRVRGIRIFDITDVANPRYIKDVQTCRGSHTHTVLVPPGENPENIYIYISGSSGVRPEEELSGCDKMAPDTVSANGVSSADFRIEVIKVPVTHPQDAMGVTQPRIFQDLAAAPQNLTRNQQDSLDRARQAEAARAARAARGQPEPAGRGGRGGGANRPRTGPTQCHDITVYPAIGLAGGACGGYGLLLDIRDPANPKRIGAVADSNFSFWHSATFSNDGSKILFSDEWGGGSAPRCRSTDKMVWGADAIFTIQNSNMNFKGYYKMPAAQTENENCVAHNGSLIPIPGREVMVQGWYQGGISVFDWTDPAHAYEIAFHDRGPLDNSRLVSGGSWSVYWYNGVIVSSEIARGLDIFELLPSAYISQNELDAAKTVHFDYLNTQGQPKLTWPASFSLSRAYLDQLERDHGQSADKIASARAGLAAAERLSGQARKDALAALAKQLHTDAASATNASKAHMMAASVGSLAEATK